MNRMLTTLASLAALPLCAESVGDLQFQFPSSQYEWKSLINNVIVENALQEALDIEANPVETVKFKLFTHREGDALEMFTAVAVSSQELAQDARPLSDSFLAEDSELAEEADLRMPEEATVQYMQRTIDQFFLKLPNHKVTILSTEETNDDFCYSWELTDGSIDVIHGYSRALKTKDGQAVLNYVTTAPHSEENRILWTQALKNASLKIDEVIPAEESPIVENIVAEILPVVTEEVVIAAVETVLPTEEVVVEETVALLEETVLALEETIAIIEEAIEEISLEEPAVIDMAEEISSLQAVVETALASNE